MKAILEFMLPDDTDAHSDALHGTAYRGILHTVDRHLHDRLKYATLNPGSRTELETLRQIIRDEAPEGFFE